MKKIIIINLLFCFHIYSQDITGNWKAISYEDQNVYYNKLKDSISFKGLYKDIPVTDRAKEIVKDFLPEPFSYKFEKNGMVTLTFKERKSVRKYIFNKKNREIFITEKKDKYESTMLLVKETLCVKYKKEDKFYTVEFMKN
jgi:hypothetical protein